MAARGVTPQLLLLCAGTVLLLAAGSGGTPGPCVQTILCLQNFIKDDFHRIKIECRDITADLTKEGGILNKAIVYDPQHRCVIWKPGNLSACRVIETKDDGKKQQLSFTYNCTRAPSTSTPPVPVTDAPALPTPTPVHPAEEPTRHHLYLAACVAPVLLLLGFSFCYLKRYPMFLQKLLRKPESQKSGAENGV